MKNVKQILITLGLLSVLYYVILTIFGGKISFSGFWIFVGVIFLLMGMMWDLDISKKFKFVREGKVICLILTTVLLISFIGIESSIIYYGSNKRMRESEYLIILGAGLRGQRMSLTLTQRMYKSLEYLKKYPNTKVIVSGGIGPGEEITEAEAMKRFLVSNGINEKQIIKEEGSTSTAENFKYTRQKLSELDNRMDIKVSIITTNFHMFRAVFLAKRAGFEEIYTVSSEIHFLLIPNYYVREYFAVIKSFLLDKI